MFTLLWRHDMVANRRKVSEMVSVSELKVLTLLARNPEGLFGSQFIALSNGFVGRGAIYTLLRKLEASGLIISTIIPASLIYQLDRPLYTITPQGRRAITVFAAEFGFAWEK